MVMIGFKNDLLGGVGVGGGGRGTMFFLLLGKGVIIFILLFERHIFFVLF